MVTLRQIWVENLNFQLKKNKIPYEIDIEPEPEGDTEGPNP